MSHGVNRGIIKSGKKDEREKFVKDLIHINKIAEVIEEGYELIGTDKNEVIIPAKVAVYILKEEG